MKYERKHGFRAWAKRYISFSFVAAVGILVYLMFFTDNSVSVNYTQTMRNDSLRREIRIEQDSLDYYKRMNQLLSTDRGTMERIVRERFHMQRAGEDVYLAD